MKEKDLIALHQFCKHYDIPISFLQELAALELIEIVIAKKTHYIHKNEIRSIEKMIRLHYELNINMEAIDVVHNLLQQIESLQEEVKELNNSLDFYKKH